MIPGQTWQVLLGLVVALLYAGAVLSIGVLSLRRVTGREGRSSIRERLGPLAFEWLGFVVGQGVLGVLWLALALAGTLYPWLIVLVCASGWLAAGLMVMARRERAALAVRAVWTRVLSLRPGHSWYRWAGLGVVVVCLLRGVIALLPTDMDDALWVYLVLARTIAFSHTLTVQPFVPPNFALLPLQVEMHWAALFALANETAVFVWDYLCAVSFLSGIGFLAWSLTSSRRVVVLAVLMMLSSPGFFEVMGGAKTDNAAAQYGMAAFSALVLWPALGSRSAILTGLCVGWAMAGRYTNVIVLPALVVFAVTAIRRGPGGRGDHVKRSWVIDAVLACAVAGLAGAPMLIKNWLLVGCPLAPQFGCQDTFWTSAYEIAHTHRQNISVVDLLFYPVVWTFASREDMLGNISPLFLGFLPFLLAYRWSPIARPAVMAGLAGLASMAVWWLVKPLILYTRWLLVPLGLLTVPLSASVVAVERDRHHGRTAKWLVGGAILTLSAFLLFQSRGVVYGLRYVVALDSRSARYESKPGYEVGAWLEAHVRRGQRIALGGWSGYPYFVSPAHLRDSESAEELQWLWARYGSVSPAWTSGLWRFYAGNGFVYVAVKKELLESAVGAWPDDMAGGRPQVVFVGRRDAVLRIERQGG